MCLKMNVFSEVGSVPTSVNACDVCRDISAARRSIDVQLATSNGRRIEPFLLYCVECSMSSATDDW